MGIADKYPERITFRVSTDQREDIFSMADALDTNVSTMVRQIVERELINYRKIKNGSKNRKY